MIFIVYHYLNDHFQFKKSMKYDMKKIGEKWTLFYQFSPIFLFNFLGKNDTSLSNKNKSQYKCY